MLSSSQRRELVRREGRTWRPAGRVEIRELPEDPGDLVPYLTEPVMGPSSREFLQVESGQETIPPESQTLLHQSGEQDPRPLELVAKLAPRVGDPRPDYGIGDAFGRRP